MSVGSNKCQPDGTDPHGKGELTGRLREQVTINSELDAEVRYLQEELRIKNEYLEELEIEIGRLHLVAAEYAAYRGRMSHRSIDGVIVRMQRLPGLYSPMRSIGRTAFVRYSARGPGLRGHEAVTAKDVKTDQGHEKVPTSIPGARLQDAYEELYYKEGLGPPYERGEAHWSEFFGQIADKIVDQLKPKTVLDAGCAIGFLVEELRARGIESRGVDSSEWAIGQVPDELQSFFKVASLTEELDDDYDLITCFEVLEHMTGHEAEDAVANLCRHTENVLFSSTPTDFEEPTHINVQTGDYWIGLFAEQGFFRELDYDATYVARHAVLLRRKPWSAVEVAKQYERAWWQARQVTEGARNTAISSPGTFWICSGA